MAKLDNSVIESLFVNEKVNKCDDANNEILLDLYSKYLNRPQIIINEVTDETFNKLYTEKIEKNEKLQQLKSNFISIYKQSNPNFVIDDNTIIDDEMEKKMNDILTNIDKSFSAVTNTSKLFNDVVLNTISTFTHDCTLIPNVEKFNMDIENIDRSSPGNPKNDDVNIGGCRNQNTIKKFANNLPLMYSDKFYNK
ncbi:hypothetical protein TONV_018 [Tipula oleracea nudivirus]|uniref:Uncharacterized protein n=1 Tax=Tipula oleracea nudivirus TaxID=1546257 RepID=A0A0B4VGI6_9VIRU|nr:hypothetical protein TONV_018 [Tipula oleracea nudivirus]AJD20078.1 hypothetical protein TONV_018 [Tipula oleracea nudivirus]